MYCHSDIIYRDVAKALVQLEHKEIDWKRSLRNPKFKNDTTLETTPFRKLIQKMPGMHIIDI